MDSRRDSSRSRFSDYRSDSRKVFVSNINFDCSIEEIKDEFGQAGEVKFVQLLKDDNKRFKGCAIVTFSDTSMADKAIDTLNRQEFQGRKLVVKEGGALPEPRKERHNRHQNDNHRSMQPQSRSMPQASVDQNMYGLSLAFLATLHIELPLVTTVFVANLEYDVTDKALKDVFVLAGNVMSCEIFKDKDGGSRGFGIVDFEHPVEAVQAISMLHNQTYKDRVITVRMDRSEKRREPKLRLPSGLKSVGMGLGLDGNALRDMKTLAAARPSMQPLMSPVGGDSLAGRILGTTALPSFGGGGITGNGSLMESLGGRMPRGAQSGQGFNSPPSSGSGTLGNIMRVTNLPLDYTSEDLRKLIWNCGDVVIAEMRSKGSGIVKLRTEADARRALQMLDRQPMDGRLLSVQLI